MITSSASKGSSRTCSASPSPVETIAKYPRSSSSRNAATAASIASGSSAVHSASVVWPDWSMRMSRDMRTSIGLGDPIVRRAGLLEAELLAHEPRDLAAVGAAARLAHHVADDDANRLHVAAAQALGDVGIGVERRLDERLELVAAADRSEPLGLDDRGGVAALRDQPVEDLLGRVLRDLLL